jgi:hypothetical protein
MAFRGSLMHSTFLSRAPAASQITKPVVVVVHKPIPFKQWPAWAVAISMLKKDEDSGVGDTVYRVIGPSNSAAFQRWYKTSHNGKVVDALSGDSRGIDSTDIKVHGASAVAWAAISAYL